MSMDDGQYSELESGVSLVKDEESKKENKGYYFLAITLVFTMAVFISATISNSLHLQKKKIPNLQVQQMTSNKPRILPL